MKNKEFPKNVGPFNTTYDYKRIIEMEATRFTGELYGEDRKITSPNSKPYQKGKTRNINKRVPKASRGV